jgi:hypothetical protein
MRMLLDLPYATGTPHYRNLIKATLDAYVVRHRALQPSV